MPMACIHTHEILTTGFGYRASTQQGVKLLQQRAVTQTAALWTLGTLAQGHSSINNQNHKLHKNGSWSRIDLAQKSSRVFDSSINFGDLCSGADFYTVAVYIFDKQGCTNTFLCRSLHFRSRNKYCCEVGKVCCFFQIKR